MSGDSPPSAEQLRKMLERLADGMREGLAEVGADELPPDDSPLGREQKELRERTKAEIGSTIEMLQAAATKNRNRGLSR